MQQANQAVDEARRAEFFRKGGATREMVKGKHWLSVIRWMHPNTHKERQLEQPVHLEPAGPYGLNRRNSFILRRTPRHHAKISSVAGSEA